MNETKLTTWEKIKVFYSDYVPAAWEEIKTFYDGYVKESLFRIALYAVAPALLLVFPAVIVILELIYFIEGSSSLTFAVIFTPIILVIAIVEYKAIRKFYKEKGK